MCRRTWTVAASNTVMRARREPAAIVSPSPNDVARRPRSPSTAKCTGPYANIIALDARRDPTSALQGLGFASKVVASRWESSSTAVTDQGRAALLSVR